MLCINTRDWDPGFCFSTLLHNFAQIFCANPIDEKSNYLYLAHQIEPEAKQLFGSVQRLRELKPLSQF